MQSPLLLTLVCYWLIAVCADGACETSGLSVSEVDGVRFLVHDATIIGAQFINEEFRFTQPVFTGFAVAISGVCALNIPQRQAALQIGLGVGKVAFLASSCVSSTRLGTVPQYLKSFCGFSIMDAIENR